METKTKRCRYCKRIAVTDDDYVFGNDMIHEEKCSFCRALNYSTTIPL